MTFAPTVIAHPSRYLSHMRHESSALAENEPDK